MWSERREPTKWGEQVNERYPRPFLITLIRSLVVYSRLSLHSPRRARYARDGRHDKRTAWVRSVDGSWRSVRDMETEVGPVTLPFTSLFMNGPSVFMSLPAPRVTRHSWPAPQPFLIPPISSPSERPGLRPAPPVVRTGDDEMGGRGGKEVTTDARQWTKGTQGEGSDRRPSTPSAPYVSRLIRSLRVSPRYARLTTSFTSESEP